MNKFNSKKSLMKRLAVLLALTTTFALQVAAADTLENYTKNCVSCHGKDGKGETKAGRTAGVKDFTDAKYQLTLKEDAMTKQIKEGMKDEKGKELMKAFADKLTDPEIKDLVAYIRAFNKK